MGLVAFDTHQFIQTLSQSGMPVAQAEAISNAVRMAYAHGASDLATKADIAVVKVDIAAVKAEVAELKAEVAELKAEVAEIKAEVAELKAEVAEIKAEFAEFKAEVATKAELAAVEMKLEHQIKLLEKSMTIRLGSMLFIAVGVMMAFMKYMQV